MSHFLFHAFSPKSPPLLSTSNHFSPIQPKPISATLLPARDRPIDFGKHKGKPLGTLPSTYLKWVSKNLRARDFEQWAKLADEVLHDPVYKDRLEWEFAEKIMNGDMGIGRSESSVECLLELSERFGWDNDDKLGWSRINFELLGCSKGGRIPRRGDSKGTQIEKMRALGGNSKILSKRATGVSEVENGRGKREERIERQRMRRGEKEGLGIGGGDKKESKYFDHYDEDCNQEQIVKKTPSRFPGRQGLLKKVLNDRRFL